MCVHLPWFRQQAGRVLPWVSALNGGRRCFFLPESQHSMASLINPDLRSIVEGDRGQQHPKLPGLLSQGKEVSESLHRLRPTSSVLHGATYTFGKFY